MSPRHSVLIVEDHIETQIFLEMVLEDSYSVHKAPTGLDALSHCKERSFDLLLVDIALGEGMDGFELVEALRRLPGYEHTPMVAMTAQYLAEDKLHFDERGFTAFLPKPFLPQDLLELIDKLLGGDAARSLGPSQ